MRRATSIRTKLVSLVALPLVLLAVFAGLGVRWSADAADRSRAAARNTEVALATTSAALEVSRERGLSVAVLAQGAAPPAAGGAGGGEVAELRFQRGQTDVALDHLATTLGAGTADRASVADLRTALEDLRGRVDRGLAVDAALGEYSAGVDRLLAAVAAGIDAIDDPGLAATAHSYGALTRVADAVGRQQSLLMPTFAAQRVDPAAHDPAVAAVAAEAVWRQQFEQGATDAQNEAYMAALRSPSVAAADRLRDETLALAPGAAVAGEGSLWLTSTTRKVDVLDGVADQIAGELAERADGHRAAAERRRMLLLALGAVAVGLIAGLLVVLDRLVVRPIRRLTGAAHEVARDTLPRAVAIAHRDGPDAAGAAAPPLESPTRDELGDLTDAFNSVQRTAVALASEQATLRRNVSEVFVNLGRRTQNLITRQIDHIDHLETGTDDPDALADLFLLDHLATRMRRNAENMLVLAGAASPRPWARPVSVVNVVRAALAESTDYSRVDIERLEPVAVVGAAVSDLSHLLAELVDNALAFSPPTERVVVTGRWAADGRYAVSVADAGIGMPPDRLAEANARIGEPPIDNFAVSKFLGLYVVGRLADRHGAEVRLAESPLGGVTAHVLLPDRLVVGPSVSTPDGAQPGTDLTLPPTPALPPAPGLPSAPDDGPGPGPGPGPRPGRGPRPAPKPSPAYARGPTPTLAAGGGDG
jgi:signal transduction histidine kinase